MSTMKVPVVIDEIDLNTLMTYFETDDVSHALSLALQWAAAASRFAAEPQEADEYSHYPKSHDDFASKSITELQRIAAYTFPLEVQEHIEELLDKKREDTITENEMKELEQLILEVQLKTVEKAKAMSVLKSREEVDS